jgi:hypothetical protein
MTVSSCPRDPLPTITITGPLSSQAPRVKVGSLDVDPGSLALHSGSLDIPLPRQLAAGTFPVSLTYGGSILPILFTPGVQYTLAIPQVTALRDLGVTFNGLPTSILAAVAWHAVDSIGSVNVAVLGGTPRQIAWYQQTSMTASMVVFSPDSIFHSAGGPNLQSSNLAVATGVAGTADQFLIAATETPGSAAFTAGSTPVVKTTSLQPTYQGLRQLVAGGYFRDGAGATQALTFVGWQSGSTSMPVVLSPGPEVTTAGTSYFGNNVGLQTAIPSPQPLALATGLLNNDASTDVVLLVGPTVGGTNNVAYTINGGNPPAAVPFQNLPTGATSVAIGNLDKDGLPDVVFGINPGGGQAGQLRVYLNQSGKTTPTITWDMTNPIQVVAPTPPTALAIADYNGDGVNDIIYANSTGVQVLINRLDANGRPQLTATQVYQAPNSGWAAVSLSAIDISGDSRPDVIVADGAQNTLRLLENSCTPAPGQ